MLTITLKPNIWVFKTVTWRDSLKWDNSSVRLTVPVTQPQYWHSAVGLGLKHWRNRTFAGGWLSLTWSVTLTHWQGQMSFYKHVTKDSCKHPQDTKRVIDRDQCHQIMKIYLNTNKNWEKITESQKLGKRFIKKLFF